MAAGDTITGPSDPELIARVRGGDTDAFGTLFARHVEAARRLARALVPGPDSEDLVSEAFIRTLVLLQRGDGPDEAFRAYLLTAVRRLHVDRVRRHRRVSATDDLDDLDEGVPFVDPAVAAFEGGAAARAFASLPERWQLVLWHLEVENDKPADIAPLLDLSPNSVSALAYRAREGLRQAFVTMHHTGDPEELPRDCVATRDRLGGFVRGALARREARKVEDHLEACRPCTGVYLELREVNSSLSGVLGPVVLGGAAASYLTGLGVGTTAAAAAGSGLLGGHLGGLGGWLGTAGGRVRDAVTAHSAPVGATVAAGVTALAVAAGTAYVLEQRGPAPGRPVTREVVSSRPSEPPAGRAARTAGTAPTRTTPPTAPPTATPTATAPPTRSVTRAGEDAGEDAGDAGGATAAADPDQTSDTGAGRDRPRRATSGTSRRPAPQADPALAATPRRATADRVLVQVVVTGVPRGRQVTLTARTSAGTLRTTSSGCTAGPAAELTCTATTSRTRFLVEVRHPAGAVLDLGLVGAPGSGGADPGNDTVRLVL